MDLRYQEPPIDGRAMVRAVQPIAEPQWGASAAEHDEYVLLSFTRLFSTITVVRAIVPVFGLMSLLVILDAVDALTGGRIRHGVLRQLGREKRREKKG
jgi:hypothetical protein